MDPACCFPGWQNISAGAFFLFFLTIFNQPTRTRQATSQNARRPLAKQPSRPTKKRETHMCVCCKEKNFIRNSISSLFFKFLFFFFSRHIEIPIAAAGEGGGFFLQFYLTCYLTQFLSLPLLRMGIRRRHSVWKLPCWIECPGCRRDVMLYYITYPRFFIHMDTHSPYRL